MNRLHPTWRWGVPAALVVCAVAFAAPDLFVASDASESPLDLAPGEAGLRAAIDPETGELAIGADAMRQSNDKALDVDMKESLSRSSAGLVEEHHPDGRVSVHLQGRFMSTSVARLGDDGRAETLCTEDAAEAEAFLADDAAHPETDAYGREVR